MRIGIRARFGTSTSDPNAVATYLIEAGSWCKNSWCEEGLFVFHMNTPAELTPRQVCGRRYTYWSLHEKELIKDKKY